MDLPPNGPPDAVRRARALVPIGLVTGAIALVAFWPSLRPAAPKVPDARPRPALPPAGGAPGARARTTRTAARAPAAEPAHGPRAQARAATTPPPTRLTAGGPPPGPTATTCDRAPRGPRARSARPGARVPTPPPAAAPAREFGWP